ncbi:ShlB/FhaC/HecB family hemolysin secretion/activation protein [Stutzerimonas kunmingensis]|uniref:ShlB/FhaC/HecB family hemolysin secretion/activation protein n=1 Tax=Stutzerimonas kunmingensis TaxID=1211807 RepID=UPI0035AE1016
MSKVNRTRFARTLQSARSSCVLPVRLLGKSILLSLLVCHGAGVQADVPNVRRPDAGSLLNQTTPPGPEPTLPSSTLPALRDEEAESAGKEGVRIKVSRFAIEGASLLPAEQLQANLSDLVGQELGLPGLRKAAARITGLYREQGYFLARAYLPTQDIVDGVVRIAVVEGRYDAVEAGGSSRLAQQHAQGILTAHQVVEGQPIERSSLERSLILLEQRSGAPVQAVMQPGATVGTSHMVIEAPSGPLFSGQLGADNYGNRYSGQNRATALLNLNSPRGVGDVASLWLMKSSDSDAVFAAYQTPVGYHGLTLGASYSQFNYQLCCDFAPLEQKGYAKVFGVQARYPLLLTQRQIVNVGLALEHKHLNDRSIVGELDDKDANVASLSLDGLAATLNGQNRYQLALAMGDLNISGPPAYVQANAATVDTAGRYLKLRGEYQYLHFVDNGHRLLLRLSGQASDRNLDSSEKFILGGTNGVRAYPEGEAAGDQALLARADWVIPVPIQALPGSLSARLFVDTGTVWLFKDTRGGLASFGVPNHYNLSGVGFGFNWNLPKGLTANLEAATKIGNNPGASAKGNDADGKDNDSRLWLGLGWAY